MDRNRSRPLPAGHSPGSGRLQDRVAIITGAARGIGAATALAFAREGAKVVICDIDEEAATATVVAINGSIAVTEPVAHFIRADVTDSTSVEQLIAQTVTTLGHLDILVNNAGITRDAQLKKMTDEEFDLVININLKGVFNCGRAAARQLLQQETGGTILNISSVAALDGNFGQSNYGAAKAAVVSMTKIWARELGPHGIRVNAVAPGFIETRLTAQMPRKIYNMMVARTPLRRAGLPQDVANALLWLASDEAAFISGVVLRVDGGIVVGT
jgi:3-oxoacyl-[acyl-carrier protein] reductase